MKILMRGDPQKRAKGEKKKLWKKELKYLFKEERNTYIKNSHSLGLTKDPFFFIICGLSHLIGIVSCCD